MDRDLQERIEDLECSIKKIDGETLFYNLRNRIYGLGKVAVPIFLYYATGENPWTFTLSPWIIDGAGDLVTGKHHFLAYSLFRFHPKYKLEKLRVQEKIQAEFTYPKARL